MSDDKKQPMRGPSVPNREVTGPEDLVVRMNESTSEEWEMVPLPARQQLGWHEDHEGGSELPERHELYGKTPQEMLHSPETSGGDLDTALDLTMPVTYHLEATPPPSEPPGAPGSAGYNNLVRGLPAAEGFEHPGDYTVEQGFGVRTVRFPEDDAIALLNGEKEPDGYAPYQSMSGNPVQDLRNASDDTRERVSQTPSVNDPYRNSDGTLKDPAEVHKAAPAHPEGDFGAKDLLTAGDDENAKPAVETEGAKAEPDGDEQQAQQSAGDDTDKSDVPDGNVGEVLKWVGDDQARARRALEAEQAKGDDARSTLMAKLNEKF